MSTRDFSVRVEIDQYREVPLLYREKVDEDSYVFCPVRSMKSSLLTLRVACTNQAHDFLGSAFEKALSLAP